MSRFKLFSLWLLCLMAYPFYKIGTRYFYGIATGWYAKEMLNGYMRGYRTDLTLPHEQSIKDIFK